MLGQTQLNWKNIIYQIEVKDSFGFYIFTLNLCTFPNLDAK